MSGFGEEATVSEFLGKLKAYVQEHPETCQSEMAEAFGCSESGIHYVLEQHKTTQKKTMRWELEQEKVAAYQAEIKDITRKRQEKAKVSKS